MRFQDFRIGDDIEVIDQTFAPYPMRGTILELDPSILGGDYAKIRVQSAAQPAPEIWVSLRLARKR
jgi:hypothetical protein